MLSCMSDCLLDEALGGCHEYLDDLPESPLRVRFLARLEVLERAVWAMGLQLVGEDEVVRTAKTILALRDEIAGARRASLVPQRYM